MSKVVLYMCAPRGVRRWRVPGEPGYHDPRLTTSPVS